VIEVVEDRMDEPDFDPRIDGESPFFFIRGQLVVFDTGIRVDAPEQMARRIGDMTPGSIFYHFIDARRRTASGGNDFSEWLPSFGDEYVELARRIAAVDPYLASLVGLRADIARVFLERLGEGGEQ
jgi:hypothetical protein